MWSLLSQCIELSRSVYPDRRDAEVLSLFATIINKLQALMEAEVPRIFEAVFEVTLTMITKNFEARAFCVINLNISLLQTCSMLLCNIRAPLSLRLKLRCNISILSTLGEPVVAHGIANVCRNVLSRQAVNVRPECWYVALCQSEQRGSWQTHIMH